MFYRATLESRLRTRSAVPLPPAIKQAVIELFSCLPLRTVIDCWGVERLLIEGTVPGSAGTLPTESASERVACNDLPVLTMSIQHPGILKALMQTGDPLVIAEAFVTGQLDIGGHIDHAIQMGRQLGNVKLSRMTAIKAWIAALKLPSLDLGEQFEPAWLRLKLHSKERDSATIKHHYDVGNEFYALWLDPKLLYSCAYFKEPDMTLEQAQEQKLDTICQKLQLKPGEKFLDIGCGWGALLRWAAEHYGVQAYGITLSEEQYAYNQMVNATRRLTERVHVRVAHYSELPAVPTYDKICSVGMVEHVGIAQYPAYFRAVKQCLKAGGLFLNHGIATRDPWTGQSVGERFIERYIFPDGELSTLPQLLAGAEYAGWEVVDVDCWRPHYGKTLRCWAENLEGAQEAATRLVGTSKYQLWRLYLIGSALAFENNHMSIFQTLFRMREDHDWNLPLHRTGWLS